MQSIYDKKDDGQEINSHMQLRDLHVLIIGSKTYERIYIYI